jgi:O-methyltransferase involved in polyketide biosynthesis
MNNTPTQDPSKRDYSSISPSARQLLLLKGFGDIPFAEKAAQLMLHPKTYMNNLDNMDFPFKARLMHFESRYSSIDQLLEGLPVNNILELSSGFSFRGLDLVQHKEVNYIDTDLPEVIDLKKQFIDALTPNNSTAPGKLQTLSLNALNEQQFEETIKLFPAGEVAILTEGLLMYLNMDEKKKLLSIIHNILEERGGYWIVADIYIRKEIDQRNIMVNDNLQGFYQAHNIEENKFESFEAAEKLFADAGLIIDKANALDYSNSGTLQKVLSSASPEQVSIIKNAGQIRATWRLKVATASSS